MKIIFKIAGNELRQLFYSPIAWFLLVVFWVQGAVIYTSKMLAGANAQEVLLKNSPLFKGFRESLTLELFLKSGLFQTAISNLYLFIPLLTMGLISHEVNSGSIRLLYSSPVRLRQIILGKYLGILTYNLLLVAIVATFTITAMFNIREVDYGMLLSALLGFYLVVCAYSAIGLFMSSVSNYQIVSALSSFTILFLLSRIGGLWQKYDLVRDLTYFLSLQNRAGKMLFGLITTKDVIYFILVAFLFVAFTLIKLQAGREAKPWYIKAGRYVGVLGIVLLIGYISSRPVLTGYWDTTATKRNTIHPRTQKLMKDLGDSTLEVTMYTNLLGSGLGFGLPENRNSSYLSGFWEHYLRFNPNVKFRYEYYYDSDAVGTDSMLYRQFPGKNLDEIAGEIAESMDEDVRMFKKPAEMHKTIDLRPENYRLVLQFKYQGRTEFVRTYDDPLFWPDEANVSAALKRLMQPNVPKVYYVTGELERSILKTGEREYAIHTALKASRGALVNIGFDIDTINLGLHDLPKDVAMLVLADPKMDLSPVVIIKLRQFVAEGGNMMVLGEPGKQYVLNPFLQELGVQLMGGQLVAPSKDETPDKIQAYLTLASGSLSEKISDVAKMLPQKDTVYYLMPGVTSFTYTNDQPFEITYSLSTLPNRAWLKAGDLVVDSTLPDFNAATGDRRENSFPTIIQLTRQINKKQQRILICGDADFMGNMRLSSNAFLAIEPYSWMNYNKNPVYLPRPKDRDILLRISNNGATVLRIAYVWVLPAATLLLATILLIRRKRK